MPFLANIFMNAAAHQQRVIIMDFQLKDSRPVLFSNIYSTSHVKLTPKSITKTDTVSFILGPSPVYTRSSDGSI